MHSPCKSKSARISGGRLPRILRAFTLTELLVVVAVMGLMMALIIPAMRGIKGAQDLTSASENIAGLFDQARTYAMANDTHVFVGIEEVSALNSPGALAETSGTGRVAIGVVASKDGTNIYGTNPSNWGSLTSGTLAISRLVGITSVQTFDNIHITGSAVGVTGANDGMVLGTTERPYVSGTLQIGSPQFDSYTGYSWPLGTGTSGASSGYVYNFTQVIEFDPEGGVWYQPSASSGVGVNGDNTRFQYLEMCVVPANGTVVASSSNCAAIQIDGLTGVNHIYRP